MVAYAPLLRSNDRSNLAVPRGVSAAWRPSRWVLVPLSRRLPSRRLGLACNQRDGISARGSAAARDSNGELRQRKLHPETTHSYERAPAGERIWSYIITLRAVVSPLHRNSDDPGLRSHSASQCAAQRLQTPNASSQRRHAGSRQQPRHFFIDQLLRYIVLIYKKMSWLRAPYCTGQSAPSALAAGSADGLYAGWVRAAIDAHSHRPEHAHCCTSAVHQPLGHSCGAAALANGGWWL